MKPKFTHRISERFPKRLGHAGHKCRLVSNPALPGKSRYREVVCECGKSFCLPLSLLRVLGNPYQPWSERENERRRAVASQSS